jgi:hypothetical protein
MFIAALSFAVFFIEAQIQLVSELLEEFSWKPIVAFAGAFAFVFLVPALDIFAYAGIETVLSGVYETVVAAYLVGIVAARHAGSLNSVVEAVKGFGK